MNTRKTKTKPTTLKKKVFYTDKKSSVGYFPCRDKLVKAEKHTYVLSM